MKFNNLCARVVLSTTIIVVASGSRLVAAQFISAVKQLTFDQVSVGAAVADPFSPFGFSADSSLAMSITPPGGSSIALTTSQFTSGYSYSASYGSQAALDAAFSNGSYTFAVTGSSPFSLSLTGNLYPTTPQIINGTWNSSGQLVIDPTQSALINLNTFAGYGTSGALSHMQIQIQSYNGGPVDLSQTNVTPTNSSPFTSYVIPAGTLAVGSIYQGVTSYDTGIAQNTTAVAGYTGVTAYSAQTFFTIVTSGTASGAPAFTLQPLGQTVAAGSTATFAIGFNGNQTQVLWFRNGISLPRNSGTSQGANLVINNVQSSDVGAYFAILVDSSGRYVQSNIVALALAAASAPAFTTQPSSQTGTTGGSVTFTVAVSGSPVPAIQWKKDGNNIVGATNVSLTLNNLQASDSGTYTAVATNSTGTATSNNAFLAVTPSSVPTITIQPQGHTVATGSSVVFSVGVTGGGLSYQWKKGGVAINGATASQFLITNSQVGDAGSYTVTATNTPGSATSNAADLSVINTSDPGRLTNVSVRIVSGTDANTLFMGFVTGGTGTSGSKQLLIRGIGPTLGGFGVPNVMLDPVLDIIPSGSSVPLLTNDDWAGAANVVSVANAVGAFALPTTTSKDSALVANLNAGVYSAKVSGKSNTTGTVLAEIYDAAPGTYSASTPRLINISARATMANDNPLIAGFVVGGSTAKTLLIRAIGPALIPYGVAAAMPDPYLEIIPSGSSVASYSNDNWGGSALIAGVASSVGAFALTDAAGKDAVILVTLDPGVYSAKVTGVNNTSGITLAEVYEVP